MKTTICDFKGSTAGKILQAYLMFPLIERKKTILFFKYSFLTSIIVTFVCEIVVFVTKTKQTKKFVVNRHALPGC